MTLATLQRAFSASLIDPRRGPAFDLDNPSGLAVYQDAYRSRLVDCLRETYEKTWSWLGDDEFDNAVRRYIDGHPPESWTLADYGEGFSRLLAASYPNDAEIAELAWLEWAMHCAFIGPDIEPIKACHCDGLDWDRATLHFSPTMQLRPVSTNCGAIWTAIAADEAPPEAETLSGPAALCVWRKGFSPGFRTLDETEFAAISLARTDAAFGEICTLLSRGRDESDAIAHLGAMLARWLEDELLAAVEDGGDSEQCAPASEG